MQTVKAGAKVVGEHDSLLKSKGKRNKSLENQAQIKPWEHKLEKLRKKVQEASTAKRLLW